MYQAQMTGQAKSTAIRRRGKKNIIPITREECSEKMAAYLAQGGVIKILVADETTVISENYDISNEDVHDYLNGCIQ